MGTFIRHYLAAIAAQHVRFALPDPVYSSDLLVAHVGEGNQSE